MNDMKYFTIYELCASDTTNQKKWQSDLAGLQNGIT